MIKSICVTWDYTIDLNRILEVTLYAWKGYLLLLYTTEHDTWGYTIQLNMILEAILYTWTGYLRLYYHLNKILEVILYTWTGYLRLFNLALPFTPTFEGLFFHSSPTTFSTSLILLLATTGFFHLLTDPALQNLVFLSFLLRSSPTKRSWLWACWHQLIFPSFQLQYFFLFIHLWKIVLADVFHLLPLLVQPRAVL